MFIFIVFLCFSIVFASRNVSVVTSTEKSVKRIPSDRIAQERDSTASQSAVKVVKIDRGPSFDASKIPNTKDYGQTHYYRIKENPEKSKSMLSMIKGLAKGMTSDSAAEEYHPLVEDGHSHGGGWSDDHHHHHHKHMYTIKGGGHSTYFSFLDLVLAGLSLISFGAFLLNLLMNLLALGGFFTTTATATYPTYTSTTTGTATGTATGGTGTATATGTGGITTTGGGVTATGGGTITATGGTGGITVGGGGGITAGGIAAGGGGSIGAVASFTAPIRNAWFTKRSKKKKKRKGRGKIKANAGFGGNKGVVGQRVKRSTWEPYVDPYTSLDIAARSILNSIAAMTNKYECIEIVFCESNRHAGIVGRGLEYFMPIYSVTTSYFGRKLGLHEKLPDHLSAIILGVQETNCQTNFPQCESQQR